MAQRDSSAPSQRNPGSVSRLESSFSLLGLSRIELLRQGFGFGRRNHRDDEVLQAEEGDPQRRSREIDPMISTESDPQRSSQDLETERQLRRHLREAGFI